MGDDQSSVDVLVRHSEGHSISLTAITANVENLLLLGTLINPEPLSRVETHISMTLDPELVGGRHVERVSQLSVTSRDTDWLRDVSPQNDAETHLAWRVETLDLGDGYRLHDARVSGDAGDMRAFGVEDLAATVGAAIFGGVAAIAIWRGHMAAKKAQADIWQMWRECLDRGGSPIIMYNMADQIGLTPSGAKIGADFNVRLRCDMPG